MTPKTKKTNKNAASLEQTRRKSAANVQQIRYAFAPILQQFRQHTKKNEARTWIPIETSLLTRYEFAALSPQTRYIFVAILLYCGANAIDEIPLDAKFMSSVLIVDERMLKKSFDELLSQNLLQEREREREKREERKEKTERETGSVDTPVSVSDFNSFSEEESIVKKSNSQKKESENGLLKKAINKVSEFTLEQCKLYVEKEISDGAMIQNAPALAMKLFRTGQADSFIKQKLFPKEMELEQFGEPILFSSEPCSVCFGAKMADVDGKGYRTCQKCKNEKGISVGYEPLEISE